MSLKRFILNDLSSQSQEAMNKCIEIVRNRDNFLICCHASPDGDALGSAAAMGYICKSLGKNFSLYNESCVPDFLEFLPYPCIIEHDLDTLSFKPETLIILDCGDRKRLGLHADKLLKLAPSVNIDHHLFNPEFGSLTNWVDTTMASTGNAVACLALMLDIPMIDELGFCLYTTFLTDTGSFSYGNTNARVLMTAAHMVNLGLNPSKVSEALNNQWTENKTKLWAYLLSTYVMDKELGLTYSIASKALLEEFSCIKEDLEGFVEQLRKIKGTRIACILREEKAFETRVSLRSQGEDDVQKLASFFGGGGHKNASGATVKSSVAEARDNIIKTLSEHKNDIYSQ